MIGRDTVLAAPFKFTLCLELRFLWQQVVLSIFLIIIAKYLGDVARKQVCLLGDLRKWISNDMNLRFLHAKPLPAMYNEMLFEHGHDTE